MGRRIRVLMPESRDSEREMAECIRKKVEDTEFGGIAEGPIWITINGGIRAYASDGRSMEDILT